MFIKTSWKGNVTVKKILRLISLAAIFALLAGITVPALMADASTFTYRAEANVLNDLGLYNGISETSFDPDLGTAVDRQTGIVMLLRMFGLADAAEALSDEDVASALAGYTDAAELASYAKKSVAYAVKSGVVTGTSATSLSPKAAYTGNMFATLILREAGYTVADFTTGTAQLADKGGLTAAEATKFAGKELIKDDLVGISFGALRAEDTKGKTVIANLVDAGVVDKAAAVGAGLMEIDLADVAKAAVAAFEAAPITTTQEIKAARDLRDAAKDKVALLPDGELKDALLDRIEAQDAKVDAAENAMLSPDSNEQ
jgi:hypothetical protein